MKIIAVLDADLERTWLGTRSRLADVVAGEPVLRQTVARVAQCKRIDAIHVLAPQVQHGVMRDMLAGLPVQFESAPQAADPRAAAVRAGRKWGLAAWRGGPGDACWFDEGINIAALQRIGEAAGADGVAIVPAAACAVDPALIDAIAEHYVAFGEDQPFVFSQAPPGLGTIVVRPAFLARLIQAQHPPGRLFTYRPHNPVTDIINKDACYRCDHNVVCTPVRFIADTHRTTERLKALLNDGAPGAADSVALCAAANAWLATNADAIPEEIEIELTTRDELASSPVRPRGEALKRSGDMDLSRLEQLLAGLEPYDDVNIVLGGFGDPLLHPEFDRALSIVRNSAALGVAVRTSALTMDEAVSRRLIEQDVDVVAPLIDAADAGAYARLHGCDGFERAVKNVEQLLHLRRQAGRTAPLVAPELVKTRDNLDQMEGFFDGWLQLADWVTIAGFNHGAGQRPDRSVRSMAPPTRRPCSRLWRRCVVLADGRYVACDQDWRGAAPLGRVGETAPADVWNGDAWQAMRAAHTRQDFATCPLCSTCDDWHRP